jgi:uncharacterized protein YgfB (UPF0149 family)
MRAISSEKPCSQFVANITNITTLNGKKENNDTNVDNIFTYVTDYNRVCVCLCWCRCHQTTLTSGTCRRYRNVGRSI